MSTYVLSLRMVDRSDGVALLKVAAVLHSRRVVARSLRYRTDGRHVYVSARLALTNVRATTVEQALRRIIDVTGVAVRAVERHLDPQR